MEDATTSTKINPTNYRKRPFPTKPQAVRDYYAQNIETRQNMNRKPENYSGFWNSTEVKEYFNSRDRIISENWSHRKFLLVLKAEAKGDPIGIMDSLLSDFTPEDYLFPLELKGREDIPEEAQAAAAHVGGRVVNYQRKTWDNE